MGSSHILLFFACSTSQGSPSSSESFYFLIPFYHSASLSITYFLRFYCSCFSLYSRIVPSLLRQMVLPLACQGIYKSDDYYCQNILNLSVALLGLGYCFTYYFLMIASLFLLRQSRISYLEMPSTCRLLINQSTYLPLRSPSSFLSFFLNFLSLLPSLSPSLPPSLPPCSSPSSLSSSECILARLPVPSASDSSDSSSQRGWSSSRIQSSWLNSFFFLGCAMYLLSSFCFLPASIYYNRPGIYKHEAISR